MPMYTAIICVVLYKKLSYRRETARQQGQEVENLWGAPPFYARNAAAHAERVLSISTVSACPSHAGNASKVKTNNRRIIHFSPSVAHGL